MRDTFLGIVSLICFSPVALSPFGKRKNACIHFMGLGYCLFAKIVASGGKGDISFYIIY